MKLTGEAAVFELNSILDRLETLNDLDDTPKHINDIFDEILRRNGRFRGEDVELTEVAQYIPYTLKGIGNLIYFLCIYNFSECSTLHT